MKTLQPSEDKNDFHEQSFQNSQEVKEEQIQAEPKKLEKFKLKDDPNNLPFRGKLISKGMFWFLVIWIFVLSFALIGNLLWFNFSISGGQLKGNSTITNNINVQPANVETPINFQNNNTNVYQPTTYINNTIYIMLPNNLTITTTNGTS